MTAALALASAWLRLQSAHFELLTDAGDRAGRDAIQRLERVRAVFGNAPGARPAPLPVRAWLFRSDRDFHAFQPKSGTDGFFQSGAERDHIVVRGGSSEVDRVVQHEYVHLVLHHSTVSLPQWFEEGMAEFYSTLEQRGEKLLVGRVVEAHVRLLRSGEWSGERAFYASSWAMVHMLNMDPRHRAALPRFVESMAGGAPPDLAFEEAFGKSRDAALVDVRAYVERGRFAVADIHFGSMNASEVEVSEIATADADLAQVELALAVGRDDSTAKLASRLRADSPEWHEAMGLLALHRKDRDTALGHLSRSNRPAAMFERAMLLRDTGAPRDQVRRALAEVVGRSPNHAEAQFLLGTLLQDEGVHEAAIAPLESAARLLPRQSYFWHALALAYHAVGRSDDARGAARRAAVSAKNAQQSEMASAALRLVARPSPPRAGLAGPSVALGEAWRKHEGDATIDGTLERIECLGTSARFHVRAGGESRALLVVDPGQVLLNSASELTFTFACGPQPPRRVVAKIRGDRSEIVAIEFP
jgi:tetratricopeptide (TPR) repeat protein